MNTKKKKEKIHFHSKKHTKRHFLAIITPAHLLMNTNQ